ncbi:hypothetical protein AA313_de0200803 [Arthrobotrys entomopaga]|nr:hypothetical protein AA313_de0200803 [Arthrobotrys entomopaga]
MLRPDPKIREGNNRAQPISETVDAKDWQRYIAKSQETESPQARSVRQEHSGIPTQRSLGPPSELTSKEERTGVRLETQEKESSKVENTIFQPQTRLENTSLEGPRPTEKDYPRLESDNAARGEEREFHKTENRNFEASRESIARIAISDDDSLDSDISDDDDDDLRIAFHKQEIKRILETAPFDKELLKFHLNTLVERYRAFSDFHVVLLMATLYLAENESSIHQCKNLLSNFKASTANSPADNIAGYMLRSIAAFRLQEYPSAYKDCRRVMALIKKSGSIDAIDHWTNHAAAIACFSAAKMGNKADELYYRSIYKADLPPPVLGAQDIRFPLPSISQILQEVSESSDTEKIVVEPEKTGGTGNTEDNPSLSAYNFEKAQSSLGAIPKEIYAQPSGSPTDRYQVSKDTDQVIVPEKSEPSVYEVILSPETYLWLGDIENLSRNFGATISKREATEDDGGARDSYKITFKSYKDVMGYFNSGDASAYLEHSRMLQCTLSKIPNQGLSRFDSVYPSDRNHTNAQN